MVVQDFGRSVLCDRLQACRSSTVWFEDGWEVARQRRPGRAGRSRGDNAVFRQQLTDRGWQYAIAVDGSVSTHDGGAVPQAKPAAP